jgi:hypothetical protein
MVEQAILLLRRRRQTVMQRKAKMADHQAIRLQIMAAVVAAVQMQQLEQALMELGLLVVTGELGRHRQYPERL